MGSGNRWSVRITGNAVSRYWEQLHPQADRPTAIAFLEALTETVPYKLHTILTNNGVQFADLPKDRDGWAARWRVMRFDQICREHGIEHRLTKPNRPWTNGQIEGMNRKICDDVFTFRARLLPALYDAEAPEVSSRVRGEPREEQSCS